MIGLDSLKKPQSIKFSDYFEILKPEYVYLSLTPDTSIRNYDSVNIIKAIHHMQKKISERIYKEDRKWVMEPLVKCSYMMDITKDDVKFYFIVPKKEIKIALAKIREVWPNITVEAVDPIAPFPTSAIEYQLVYKREDAFSLAVERKSNEPLNHSLNVIDILEEKDRVAVFYNFMPCSQFTWTAEHDKTMKKVKSKEPIDRQKKSVKYAGKYVATTLLEFVQGLLDVTTEMFGGEVKEKKNESMSMLDFAISTMNFDKDVSTASKKKRSETVIDTQIVILSDSQDKVRKTQNALALCQSYKVIEEENVLGNELIHKRVNRSKKDAPFNYESYRAPKVESNKMSFGECQNFIQLPGKELLMQFKNIGKVDVNQTEVPIELQNGILRAGVNTYRGKKMQAYHTEHKELKHTAVCICGPNRSGKSTLFANMVYDAIKDGRTVILPDFCGACQLSDELGQVIPKEKIINIYCNDYNTLQGFGYNEIIPRDDSIFEIYNCAKMKAARLKEFINLVNDGDNDLEGRMERFMEYAALITFINNGSVNDVFKMVKDHVFRHELIDNIPEELKDQMDEYVTELCEIDEVSTKGDNKGEIIGTKQSHISAILSRVHRLKQNAYVEMMLKKDTKNNIDLLKCIGQGGKLICIRMYDSMFISQQQKDIYACYWVTKIWGALQMRYCSAEDKINMPQVAILIDELYQTKNCETYLTTILSQIPKYRAKLIVSCHHLAQIPVIQEEMKSAMCSYMFLRGSNKKNYYAMKEEFEDLGFSLDDLLHLKQYESLNLFSYEDGYWAGITHLPLPVNYKEPKKEVAAEVAPEVVPRLEQKKRKWFSRKNKKER